ncbi:hypothetical protein ACKUB1_13425 [Methanospirillum stamsii]|uniref:Uncharacterized protein n=1 Tax=Methanospirillum stamsii TaxID=1277351 RepID=A0A2V2MMP3_9EURY|nr:hypothetical protein [Methanospirillum stamsii]PWR69514.1 hypothetical protein DLD82_17850 [Methanospirillum stamsii]
MNPYMRSGVLSLILLFFLTGMGMALELPADIFYIQGGASTITEESTGTYEVIVQDIVPYLHITDRSQGTSSLTNIEKLETLPYSMNGVLMFSGEDNESSLMAEVSNVSVSDGNKTLKFLAKPLDFYDGDVLKPFAHDTDAFIIDEAVKSRIIGIYLEIFNHPPQNAHYPIFNL